MKTSVAGVLLGVLVVLGAGTHPAHARPDTHSISPRVRASALLGRENPSHRHNIVVGLDLRNRDELEQFLADVQDPRSPVYHRFLTQAEFNARYAPAADAEQRVVDYLQANGITVTERFANRLLVGGSGTVGALERAFSTALHNVTFNGEAHYAAISEPVWPAEIADSIVGIVGLDDLSPAHPHLHGAQMLTVPHAALGSSCCHLSPNDLSLFYDEATASTGAGETVVIAGVYAWADTDVETFDVQWGLPALPAGSGQVCTASGGQTPSGCKFSGQNSDEISLDVEYAHGTAPDAVILNYMAASSANSDLTKTYNRIVSDNPGHVVTTSWGSCEAETSTASQLTNDNIFANANAVGQTWFAASGDTGSRDCGTFLTVDHPANSPHVMGTGGTVPTCSSGLSHANPTCGGYGSESGWSDSGGGVSEVFARPAFQSGCSVPSGTQRLVPDVAIEAGSPGNYVAFGGSWYFIGGTSDAAPQWAGIFAELNQQAGGSGLGNPGAQLYGLCGTAAFHDIVTGSNGTYSAGVGYDMVTGLGSPDVAELLALSAPTTPTPTVTGTPPTPTPTATPTPPPQCVSVAQPTLSIGKLLTPPGDDTLTFTGKLTIPFPFNPTLDPRTNGVEILIQDATGTVLDATIPGGAFSNPPNKGWKVNRQVTKWTYLDRTSTRIGGISEVIIQDKSSTTPGLVTFTVKGKKGSYAVTPGDLPVTARMLLSAAGQECGNASFASCTFNASGSTLKCK